MRISTLRLLWAAAIGRRRPSPRDRKRARVLALAVRVDTPRWGSLLLRRKGLVP